MKLSFALVPGVFPDILRVGCQIGCWMRGKITKRVVDALEDGILWDPELRGFGVRARSGNKHYMLKFRAHGKQRWHTIGRHGSPWTAEQARREARRLLGELAAGKHAPAGKERTTISDQPRVS